MLFWKLSRAYVMMLLSSFIPRLSRSQARLSSSHRSGAQGGQEVPSGWGRTGRTGRTIDDISLCSCNWKKHFNYLLVVETLGVLLSLVLGLLLIDIVEALGLNQLVDLSTSKAGKELLSELVVDRLALPALSLLKGVHGSERGTASEELVAELALVVVVVDLVVGVVGFTFRLLAYMSCGVRFRYCLPQPNILNDVI